MKFVPNLRRVLLLNALGLGLILAIFLAIYYPAWETGQLTQGRERVTTHQEMMERSFSPDFYQAKKTAKKFQTIMPLAVLGLVFLTSVALMIFHFTEIPRYVEFTAAGVRLGRWLTQETFIPYQEIIQVYERRQYRLISTAICIRTLGKRWMGHCIVKYAFHDWPEIYRQLQFKAAGR